jgi:hypothetical protein
VLTYGWIFCYLFGGLPGIKGPKKGYVVEIMDLAFWCIPAIFYYPKRWKEFR